MKKIMFVVIVSIILAGCSSVDSIKIGGGYTTEDGTKIEGDVEVVLNKEETASIGLNVLKTIDQKRNFVILEEKQVSKLLEKVDTEKKMTEKIGIMKRLFDLVR